jgi:thioredoxin-related protein
MTKSYILYLLVLLFTFAGCSKKSTSQDSSTGGAVSGSKAVARISQIEQSEKIVWLTFDEAAQLNQVKKKKIFVDVYTSWCGWCKRMEATTLQDPAISRYLNEKYFSVKLNAESNKKLVYNGQEMTEADLAKNIFQATGYPTTVYLNEEVKVLQPVPGYLDVDMLNKILHFYGDDAYKTTTWDRFRLSFNAE